MHTQGGGLAEYSHNRSQEKQSVLHHLLRSMSLFFKRHFTSRLHLDRNPTSESRILELCKSGSLTDAIRILNSTDQTEIYGKPIIYGSLLQTCTKSGSFIHGLQLHAHVVKSGLETDRFAGNSLLALYFKLGTDFAVARKVFDGLFFKDEISWTSMVSGYVKAGKPMRSIESLVEMLRFDLEPNAFALSSVIKACSDMADLKLGKIFHGIAISRGFESNTYITSGLIDLYGKTCRPKDARQVFDEMPEPDAICWTAVVSAFNKNDMYREALGFFYLMYRDKGLVPDGHTFGTVLMACGNLERLKQGKEIHAKVITSGFCGYVVVESSLVDMYGKCGSVREAKRVFNRMSVKNSVSWCALLGGCCQSGDFKSVISLFRKMEEKDLYSYGTVLRACAGLAAVRHGKEVHGHYIRKGGWRNVIVESALVDLYAKCGCFEFAHRVFSQMLDRNMITWNAMICGFAQNGRAEEALGIYNEMIREGYKPDSVSFVGVLFACSHTGMVDEGRKYFASMSDDYGIKAGTQHYSCVVDLLGRAGLLEEAESLVENSDYKDDPYLWGVLLGACTACTDSIIAERIAKRMMKLKPNYHMSYVLLSNLYKTMGRYVDALEIRKLMEKRGVEKTSGKSWIEKPVGI